MSDAPQRLQTKLIHAGEPSPRIEGAVAMPIFQSATFESGAESGYHGVRYARLNNTPNHLVLHRKLAALEGAEAALVAGSGMAAISATLLALLKTGDHVLVQDCLYGGTHDLLVHDLTALGIAHDFVDAERPETWSAKLRATTRAIYVETLTNPLLQVIDGREVVKFARAHGLVSVIDNTFASPVNFRPSEWGFDISVHSATKYLNGHSDVIAGAVIGRAALVEKITHKLNHIGGTLDPHAAFLLHRGMKTLALRVRHQNESALRIARFLEAHGAVTRVNHPGLERHPGHALAREILDGTGGMLSFELAGGLDAAREFVSGLHLAIVAPSLGGVETLVTRPAATSHAGLSREERERVGIGDGLVRVSVGIEATEDVIEDFTRALGAVRSAGDLAAASAR